MNIQIRPAAETDAAQILAIYQPFIENTSITFEYEVPNVEVIKDRILKITETYPWLVLEVEGQVGGFAYASKFRERKAYNWCAESSIYLSSEFSGKGYGYILYQCLFDLLKEQGFFEVIAVITWPNQPSENFHTKVGFEHCGIIKKSGFKFEKWQDILIMQKELRPIDAIVNPVVPFCQLESAAKIIASWNSKLV